MGICKQGDAWTVRRHVAKHFSTRKEAESFDLVLESSLAEAQRRHDTQERPCRIRDRLNEFLSDSAIGLRRRPCNPRTVELHRKRLLAFDQAFHSRPLDSISREELEAWTKRRMCTSRGGKRIQADTVNADLVSLRAFAKWAQEKGYAPASLPLMTVGRLTVKGKIPGTNSKLPKAMEMAELLDVLHRIEAEREDVGLVLQGMLFFCLRPAAVCALRRRDVVLPRAGSPGRLESKALKGHFDRSLPIFPGSEQHAWIMQCLDLAKRAHHRRLAGRTPALDRDEPLVTNLAGRSRCNPGGWTTAALDQALIRICEKLDLRFNAYMVRHSVVS